MPLPQPSKAASVAPEKRSAPSLDFVLPPLPTTLAEALQVVSQKTNPPDSKRLIEIVKTDPVTAAYILKRINSPYYGLRREVSEIERAANLLGFTEVCNLVIAAGLKKMNFFQQNSEELRIYDEIMRGSVTVAAFSKRIAGHLNLDLQRIAFSAGLLHQIGRLVLLNSVPEHYVSMWWQETGDEKMLVPPAAHNEKGAFGIEYTNLGAITVQRWKLPKELAVAISFHRNPLAVNKVEHRELTLAVASSAHIVRVLQRHPDVDAETLPPTAFLSPSLVALADLTNLSAEEFSEMVVSETPQVRTFVSTMLDA